MPRISYEPEADILMWEFSNQKIDFAKEVGDFIVHYSKKENPVLVEILEASKFLLRASRLVNQEASQEKVNHIYYAHHCH